MILRLESRAFRTVHWMISQRVAPAVYNVGCELLLLDRYEHSRFLHTIELFSIRRSDQWGSSVSTLDGKVC